MADERYRQLWEERMIKQFGSLEAAKEEMRRRSKLQEGIPKRTSGFANKDLAKKAGELGAAKRWNKDN